MAVRIFAMKAKSITSKDLKLLLRLLHPLIPDLPTDPRTLRKTPRRVEKIELTNGCYIHLGLKSSLRMLLPDHKILNDMRLYLQLNIDGIRVYDYPGTEMWPILGKIVQPFNSGPFVVGCYSGRGKPEPLSDYLNAVVQDLDTALSDGIQLTELITVQISLQCIICDSVARSYIRQVKSHVSYNGCDKCLERGCRITGHRTSFINCDSENRNDGTFRSKIDFNHHIGLSPFERLPIDMVKSFPLDPMHLVYLGVVKRILTLWKTAERGTNIRLSGSQTRQIESQLSLAAKQLTVDFPRKCASFQIHERWKATECRQFLLYLGPVVLKHSLHPKVYNNFVLLSSIMYALSHPKRYREMLPTLRLLITRFIKQYKKLYGLDQVVYNIHCLSHICDDVELYGPLERFSAFPFESYMRVLKGDVKGPKCPATQLYNRITERAQVQDTFPHSFYDDIHNSLACKLNKSFHVVHENLVISPKPPDNCFMQNGIPHLIMSIDGSLAHCKRFVNLCNLYEHAFPSSDFSIFIASSLSITTFIIPLDNFSSKCLCFTQDNSYYIFPIIHTIKK